MTLNDSTSTAAAGAAASPILDVTDPETWPYDLCDLIEELSQEAGAAEYVSELDVPDDADDQARKLLAGHRIQAFHATRLLDHEQDMIAEQGLRVFSRELFEERIHTAHAHAAITKAERRELLQAHMYATETRHSIDLREGKVCFALSGHAFDDDPSGFRPQLSTWGGESIYHCVQAAPILQLLCRLGRPTIVVVAAPVLPSATVQSIFPELARLLVGAVRSLRVGATLHHPEQIRPDDVIALWQPGDARYDQYSNLPRS